MRDIDVSLVNGALRKDKTAVVDLFEAQRQHNELFEVIKRIGISVSVLESAGFADSVFIEDTAVIIDKVALITNPGAVTRRGETAAVKDHLLKKFPDFDLVEVNDGILDGGDVLFTGKFCKFSFLNSANSENIDEYLQEKKLLSGKPLELIWRVLHRYAPHFGLMTSLPLI